MTNGNNWSRSFRYRCLHAEISREPRRYGLGLIFHTGDNLWFYILIGPYHFMFYKATK